jgi:hypothetical protein
MATEVSRLAKPIMSSFISRLMVPSSDNPLTVYDFQMGFLPLMCGMALAMVLSCIIRETGSNRKHGEVGGRDFARPRAARRRT